MYFTNEKKYHIRRPHARIAGRVPMYGNEMTHYKTSNAKRQVPIYSINILKVKEKYHICKGKLGISMFRIYAHMTNERKRGSKCIFSGWTIKQLGEERRTAHEWEECNLKLKK